VGALAQVAGQAPHRPARRPEQVRHRSLSLSLSLPRRPPADSLHCRLAKMIYKCDMGQTWLENITYQMCVLSPFESGSTFSNRARADPAPFPSPSLVTGRTCRTPTSLRSSPARWRSSRRSCHARRARSRTTACRFGAGAASRRAAWAPSSSSSSGRTRCARALSLTRTRATSRKAEELTPHGPPSSSQFDSILGGSEEVLADLGVRQAMKRMPQAVL